MRVFIKSAFTGLLIFLGCLMINACKKVESPSKTEEPSEVMPSADFSFDKTEYTTGEKIVLTNKSVNANNYRWTLPDGQTSKEFDLTWTAAETGVDYQAAFKLEAFSASGNKSDYAVKNVKIIQATGKLVLHGGYYGGSIAISIDGVSKGSVKLPTSSMGVQPPTPVCDQNGYPTYGLKTGIHTVNANCPAYNTTNTVVIKANDCTVLRIF